ncbi:MAG: hypothetical protein PUH48_02560, partial [Prevotella sp.]|nr:hypothetical protein [Prevotella sp.]
AGLVNIHLAIFTNSLKLVGIYGVLESAHIICILSNKHFHAAKIRNKNDTAKKWRRNILNST